MAYICIINIQTDKTHRTSRIYEASLTPNYVYKPAHVCTSGTRMEACLYIVKGQAEVSYHQVVILVCNSYELSTT